MQTEAAFNPSHGGRFRLRAVLLGPDMLAKQIGPQDAPPNRSTPPNSIRQQAGGFVTIIEKSVECTGCGGTGVTCPSRHGRGEVEKQLSRPCKGAL